MRLQFIFCLFFGLFLFNCGNKKTDNNSDTQVEPAVIEQLENENKQLDELDKVIEKDIQEVDKLVKELENI